MTESEFDQQKDEVERVLQTDIDESKWSKTVTDLMKKGKGLLVRVLGIMGEMIGSVEQKWFQGDRSKMVGTMVGGC